MSSTELTVDGKPLSSLRVVDLKEELEKVGLSKSGSKKELYERLKGYLTTERQRQAAAADEEQLPNISIQKKLAEDNPFLRDYFESQAELFHTQKLQKKLYHEEKKRESEASSEGGDSPVKSRGGSPMKSPPTFVTNSAVRDLSNQITDNSQQLDKDKILEKVPEVGPIVPSPTKSRDGSPLKNSPAIVVNNATVQDQLNTSTEISTKIECEEKSVPEAPLIPSLSAPTEILNKMEDEKKSEPEAPHILSLSTPSEISSNIECEKKSEPETPRVVLNTVKPKSRWDAPAKIQPPVIVNNTVVQDQDHSAEDLEKCIDKDDGIKEKLELDAHVRMISPTKSTKSSEGPPEENQHGLSDNKTEDQDQSHQAAENLNQHKEVSDYEEKRKPKEKSPAKKDGVPKIPVKITEHEIQVEESKISAEEPRVISQALEEKPEKVVHKEPAKRRGGREIVFDLKESKPEPPRRTMSVRSTDRAEGKEIVFNLKEGKPEPLKRTMSTRSTEGTESREIVFDLKESKAEPRKRTLSDRSTEGTESREIVFDLKEDKPEPPKRALSLRVSSTERLDDEVLDFGEEDKDKSEDTEVPLTFRKLNIKTNPLPREGPAVAWKWKRPDEGISFNPTWEHFKEMLPDLEFLPEEEVKLDIIEPDPANVAAMQEEYDRQAEMYDFQITRTISNEFVENGMEIQEQKEEDDFKPKIDLPLNRKISTTAMEEEEEKELTPSRNPPSHVIKVSNLVRPFTLVQLKGLLQRTGNVVDIWVDKIKSKCVAKFENQDEAMETRAALHGVKWPASNTKSLQVDFTTEEVLEDLRAKDQTEDKPKIEDAKHASASNLREWDKGKRPHSRERQHERDRRRSTSRDRKRVRRDSNDERNSRTVRDHRGDRPNDREKPATTGKALDELFRKTVATPCIYWLPLTPQQIAEKEEVRRKRMLERDRKITEMSQFRQR